MADTTIALSAELDDLVDELTASFTGMAGAVSLPDGAAAAPAAPAKLSAAAAAPAAKLSAATAAAKKPAAKKPATKRRGPGRPPSKPPSPPLEMKGVVDAPKDVNDRLEFVFGTPTVFKSLFSYLKNIRARDIHIRCAPNGLTFFARDHTKTSRIVAVIAGEHVNWHYCESEFWLGLNRESVDKMFGAIDKTFFKITIVQTHDDVDSLIFTFKDAEIDKECNYKVMLSAHTPDLELYEAEQMLTPDALSTLFPIEFTLTAKQFKKSISDASNYSEQITFEKLGAHPLQLTYAKSNIIYNEVYRTPEKIQLQSTVPPGATFRCRVKLANIKSLANSMVTEDVRVLCRENDDILFRSAIDAKALVVSTLTRLA